MVQSMFLLWQPLSFNKDASLSGNDYKYGPQKNEGTDSSTLYANYAKYFENIKSNVDLTAGYDYQYLEELYSRIFHEECGRHSPVQP